MCWWRACSTSLRIFFGPTSTYGTEYVTHAFKQCSCRESPCLECPRNSDDLFEIWIYLNDLIYPTDSDITISYRNLTFLAANVLALQYRSKHKLSIKANSTQNCFKLIKTIFWWLQTIWISCKYEVNMWHTNFLCVAPAKKL